MSTYSKNLPFQSLLFLNNEKKLLKKTSTEALVIVIFCVRLLVVMFVVNYRTKEKKFEPRFIVRTHDSWFRRIRLRNRRRRHISKFSSHIYRCCIGIRSVHMATDYLEF